MHEHQEPALTSKQKRRRAQSLARKAKRRAVALEGKPARGNTQTTAALPAAVAAVPSPTPAAAQHSKAAARPQPEKQIVAQSQTITVNTGELVEQRRPQMSDLASLQHPPLAALPAASLDHKVSTLNLQRPRVPPHHANIPFLAPFPVINEEDVTDAIADPQQVLQQPQPRQQQPSGSTASDDAAGSTAGENTHATASQPHDEEDTTADAAAQAPAYLPAPPTDAVAPVGTRGRRVFLHGNYHAYYGYRLQENVETDPRFAVLQRQWFARRRCMDVGCNEGIITLGLASQFGVKSMIGVDLDQYLIARACQNLRTTRSAAVNARTSARKAGTPSAERRIAKAAMSALAQTWFVHADFLEARADQGSVDTLTAFSVTKWVHLHRGDEGLLAFFGRVKTLLAPGGLFVLEPQPWRSYSAARNKIRQAGGKELIPQHGYFHRMSELKLRPETFPELLESQFGLKLIRQMQCPGQEARGFDRPMYLLKKV